MSYCKFQNTFIDLQDCVHTLYNAEESFDELKLSEEENTAMKRMYALCKAYMEEFDRLYSDNEED
jgi:hypothetical protein